MQLVAAGTPKASATRDLVFTVDDLPVGTLGTDLVVLMAARYNATASGSGAHQVVAGSGLVEGFANAGGVWDFLSRAGLASTLTFPITVRNQFSTIAADAHVGCLFSFRGTRAGAPNRHSYFASAVGVGDPGNEDTGWQRLVWNSLGTLRVPVLEVTDPDPLLPFSWAYLKVTWPLDIVSPEVGFGITPQMASFAGRSVNTDRGRVADVHAGQPDGQWIAGRFGTGYDNTGGAQPRTSPMPLVTPSEETWEWWAIGYPGDPWTIETDSRGIYRDGAVHLS